MFNGEYIDYFRDESYIKLKFDKSINYLTENEKMVKFTNKYYMVLLIFVLIIIIFYFSNSNQNKELSQEMKKIENYHRICHYGILLMKFRI